MSACGPGIPARSEGANSQVPGQERVLYPGLLEAEEVGERQAHGIPLHREVIDWFTECTRELQLAPLATLEARGRATRH